MQGIKSSIAICRKLTKLRRTIDGRALPAKLCDLKKKSYLVVHVNNQRRTRVQAGVILYLARHCVHSHKIS